MERGDIDMNGSNRSVGHARGSVPFTRTLEPDNDNGVVHLREAQHWMASGPEPAVWPHGRLVHTAPGGRLHGG